MWPRSEPSGCTTAHGFAGGVVEEGVGTGGIASGPLVSGLEVLQAGLKHAAGLARVAADSLESTFDEHLLDDLRRHGPPTTDTVGPLRTSARKPEPR